jgi:glycosyltransferase involved in cell wall biosynthesis
VNVRDKIKVLQIQLRYNVSASDLAEQILLGLPASGFSVTTAFLRGQPQEGEPESRAERSVYFDFSPVQLKGLRRWLALWQLLKHCRREQYDVIIAHRFKPMSMLMWLNRFMNIPVCIGVQHGIGDYDRFWRRVEARVLMASNWRIVGVSSAVEADLLSRVPAFSVDNMVCINNAIDIERAESLQMSGEAARKNLVLPGDAFIFGCIGRLVPVKGHDVLIEALSLVAERYSQAHVAIIGGGRSLDELVSLASRLGVSDRVHFIGAKADALQYVRAFDVFVMPSRSEGLPLSLLEGLSGRLPVIGSDIDSLRPILEDSGGLQFALDNARDLASRLEEMLETSEEQRAQAGERGYRYLCDAHDIEDFRSHYRQLISDMLQNGQEKADE